MNREYKKTILLVEDEVIISTMEKMELEKYGYTVHNAITGEDAVKVILNNVIPVDLILMDIDLGSGIDGTQAAEQILNNKDIPIVFLSSHAEPEVVEKTEKITSYGYVVKNSGIVVLDTSIKMAFKLFEANIKLMNELQERKRAEETIREMDVRMRKLFANVPDLIFQFTRRPDGSYYVPIASKGIRNIFGCSPDDVRDNFEPISRVIYPEDAVRVIEDIEYSAKNLTYFTCEFRVHIPGKDVQWILSRSTPEKLPDGSITWYGFNVDITERKNAEGLRQAEENNLRITLNSIGDAVISTDSNGKITRMNPVAEKLCGWEEVEACGKNLDEVFYIINANTRERVNTPLEEVIRNGRIAELDNHTVLLSKDGNEYKIADSAAPITTNSNESIGAVFVFRDITEQYEKDRQLQERLKELNCLYKIAGIVEKPDITLDKILQEIVEIIPQSWQYPEICEAKISMQGKTFQTDNFLLSKWCQSRELIVNGTESGKVTICYREERPSCEEGPFLKDERDLLNAVAERVGRIIERKQLEEKLHSLEWMLTGKKEKKKKYMPEYGDLTELNKNGLILSSLGKDQLMQISSEYLNLLETSSAIYEKNGDYALGLFSSGWCQFLDTASRKLCKTDDNKDALACGKWLCHESCWQDASLKAINSGKPIDAECCGGIHLYAVPISVSGEIVGAINVGYGNPPEDDVKLQQISDQFQVPIEVLQKKREEYQARPPFIIDYAKKRIQNSARLIGNLVEREQAIKKLAENEALLSRSQDIAHIGSWKLDLSTNSLDWSDEVYHIFGCEPQGFTASYEVFLEFIHPDDRKAVDDAYSLSLREGKDGYKIEHRILRQDTGDIRYVLERCFHVRDDTGSAVQSVGMIQDITEQKQVENQIKEYANRLELTMEAANMAWWEMFVDSGNVNFSSKKTEMLSYSSDQFNHYHDFTKLVHPDDNEPMMTSMKSLLNGSEKKYDIEYRIKAQSGEYKWFHDIGTITQKTNKGRPLKVSGIVIDITESKLTETYREMTRNILQILNQASDLQQSIQRVLDELKIGTGADAVGLRLQEGKDYPYFVQDGFPKDFLLTENTLLKRGNDGGVCLDKDGNISLECTCGLVISGKTDPSNPLFTKGGSSWTNDSFPVLDLPPDQDIRKNPRNNCIHQGYASIALIPIRTDDRIVGLIQLNDKRKGRFTLETIEILESIAAHIGSALVRKQAEEKIKKQLFEKEILLREVHHRVKNNIANIESLLSLQSGSTVNTEVKIALQDAMSRVQSMRILYDKLLISADLREVSIKSYIEDLIESLNEVLVEKGNIIIETHISDFRIVTKLATTIGIIINELLTNVFKYAFKNLNNNTVSVSIEKNKRMVTITIHDNGIGINDRIIEHKSSGFGLTIVRMLVEQLKGSYSIENDNGTKSVIKFDM